MSRWLRFIRPAVRTALDEHRNDKAKKEIIVTLHWKCAATFDAGIDGWLHQMMHDMGAASTLSRGTIAGERLDARLMQGGLERMPVALRTQRGQTTAVEDHEHGAAEDVGLQTVLRVLIPERWPGWDKEAAWSARRFVANLHRDERGREDTDPAQPLGHVLQQTLRGMSHEQFRAAHRIRPHAARSCERRHDEATRAAVRSAEPAPG